MAVANEAKVEANLAAFAVSLDEKGQEVLSPVTEIDPGELIEYQIDYKNVSDEELSGFVVSGDIPDATRFVEAQKFDDYRAVFEVEVAGIGWGPVPVIRYLPDERGVLRSVEVPPEEYERVRWLLTEPMSPGEQISVSYRIRVER